MYSCLMCLLLLCYSKVLHLNLVAGRVLFVLACCLSVGFIPQAKDMQIRLTGYLKLHTDVSKI